MSVWNLPDITLMKMINHRKVSSTLIEDFTVISQRHKINYTLTAPNWEEITNQEKALKPLY